MPLCETCPIHEAEWREIEELFNPLLDLMGGGMYNKKSRTRQNAVSYTHLTLPTNREV